MLRRARANGVDDGGESGVMKNFAIMFACWMAYAVATKQGWMDTPRFLQSEAPWWAEAIAVLLVAFAVFVGVVSLWSTWIAARVVSKAGKR